MLGAIDIMGGTLLVGGHDETTAKIHGCHESDDNGPDSSRKKKVLTPVTLSHDPNGGPPESPEGPESSSSSSSSSEGPESSGSRKKKKKKKKVLTAVALNHGPNGGSSEAPERSSSSSSDSDSFCTIS